MAYPLPSVRRRLGDRLHALSFGSLDRTPAVVRERARQAIFDIRYAWGGADPWCYATDTAETARHQALLAACGPATDWALEVGCGTGHLSRALIANERARQVVGIDISEVAVRRASRHVLGDPDGWRSQFHQLDITQHRPTWFGQRFGLIVCADILYYLPTRDQLASASNRLTSWLTPGGRLVLGHPAVRAAQLHATPGQLDQLQHVERVHTGTDPDYQIDIFVCRSSDVAA
jgi:2-polyprenyl-3-methyl-5-hydroxy-6-metoxy-1,4-benzoquinol methylase